MTVGRGGIICEILRRGSKLIVDVAREVPFRICGSSDARIGGFRDELPAILTNILEHERNVGSGDMPISFQKRVRLSIESTPCLRMFETREIVIVAVNDDGRILDAPGMEPVRRFTANRLREAECEETDACHESGDDTKKSDLLTPCPLLLGSTDSW